MNPNTCLIVGLLFYFLTLCLSRFFSERNYRSLSSEDKLKLTDAFSTQRSLATYVPIGIMLGVMVAWYVAPKSTVVVFPLGVLIILIAMFLLQMVIIRRLNELSLPAEFVNKFQRLAILVQIGNVVSYSLIVYGFVG